MFLRETFLEYFVRNSQNPRTIKNNETRCLFKKRHSSFSLSLSIPAWNTRVFTWTFFFSSILAKKGSIHISISNPVNLYPPLSPLQRYKQTLGFPFWKYLRARASRKNMQRILLSSRGERGNTRSRSEPLSSNGPRSDPRKKGVQHKGSGLFRVHSASSSSTISPSLFLFSSIVESSVAWCWYACDRRVSWRIAHAWST